MEECRHAVMLTATSAAQRHARQERQSIVMAFTKRAAQRKRMSAHRSQASLTATRNIMAVRKERRARGECRIITRDQYAAECEMLKAIRKEGARKKQLI